MENKVNKDKITVGVLASIVFILSFSACPMQMSGTNRVSLLEYVKKESIERCLGKAEGDLCRSGTCVINENGNSFSDEAGRCVYRDEVLECNIYFPILSPCDLCVEEVRGEFTVSKCIEREDG